MPFRGGYSGGGGTSAGGINVTGTVPTSGDLPATGTANSAYLVQDTGHLWVWTGSRYTDAGPISGPAGPRGTTGPAGPAGVTPTITDGVVTVLGAGAQPTAAVVMTGPNTYRLDLGIPVGAQGAPGQAVTSGHGPPSGTTPASQPGSLYLDLDTYDLYKLS